MLVVKQRKILPGNVGLKIRVSFGPPVLEKILFLDKLNVYLNTYDAR